MARRVSSISVYDPSISYQSKKLYGDVKLVAGRNIKLTVDTDRNAVVISADSSSEYNEVCDCGTETTVKTINGISVENVTLVGDDCVEVVNDGKTIRIRDKCSKPCCGCAEIDFINEKISQINTSINKLDNFAGSLNDRMTELQNSYVQSETGDTGDPISGS